MSPLATIGAATLALVTQDAAPLRAAPTATAAQHAQLSAGDLIELRGQRFDHWQVYDHRRERAGFVRQSAVRTVELDAAHAPQLLTVARFLADTPGAEALGIAYVAAYLKAAPAAAIDAEPFDLLGEMAQRLARRASARPAIAGAAAQMQTVAPYGVTFTTFERGGALQLCYDGDAFRRVLAFSDTRATPDQRARATLALTRHDCIDPGTPTRERLAHDEWRADRLDAIDATAMASLPGPLKNRLRLRRAGVGAALAFAHARTGQAPQAAAQRAIDELAAVDRMQLGDTEVAEYEDAALRVGASRWAAAPPMPPAPTSTRLALATQPGADAGQTCITVGDPARPFVSRCTFGTVWAASWRVAPDGNAAVLAVQLLPTWTELWVMRARREGWSVDVLTPTAASEPGIGYAEFAGFVPQQRKLLVAREAKADGKLQRRFEVLSLDTLAAERWASTPQLLAAFGRWQDAAWVRGTVALR